MEKRDRKNKKGQVAIFIILALAIVIVLFFLIRGRGFESIISTKTPIAQIQSCVEDEVLRAEDILSEQGGEINPEFYYRYKGMNLSYLCYTEEYMKTCVMQKPLLWKTVEKEIENFIEPKVQVCMQAVKSDLEKDGYQVRLGEISSSVDLVPGSIFIDIKSDINCVVARIIKAEKHPNADRLKVCDVDIGGQNILKVVCGASNAQDGLLTIYAPPGSIIPKNNMKLEVSKIRGVTSYGMLCSEAELNISNESQGIISLSEKYNNMVGKSYFSSNMYKYMFWGIFETVVTEAEMSK